MRKPALSFILLLLFAFSILLSACSVEAGEAEAPQMSGYPSGDVRNYGNSFVVQYNDTVYSSKKGAGTIEEAKIKESDEFQYAGKTHEVFEGINVLILSPKGS